MAFDPCSETALEEVLVKVLLGCTLRNGPASREGLLECGGKEPLGSRTVLEIAVFVHMARRL